MNTTEIADIFIRAAEVDRLRERIGPQPPRSIDFGYVHDWIDKLGWGKVKGDKLVEDALIEERRRFWEQGDLLPTARELSELAVVEQWLVLIDDERERRALLAWAVAMAGGRRFNRWCSRYEGIHVETGRKRKNRALSQILAKLARTDVQNDENEDFGQLIVGPEIDHVSATVEEVAATRENDKPWWQADDAFQPIIVTVGLWEPYQRKRILVEQSEFDWARKRNERRRQLAARKAKQAEKARSAKAKKGADEQRAAA